ncbi:MAG TPA: hydrolase TatD [Elusimicrobia bacterium]|jgi:TatD DNase family protein|nr:hydrolase TatD [Elusimicrobiota bacterium]
MFDTHTHLSDKQFANDLGKVISSAQEDGVEKILTIWDLDTPIEGFLLLLEKYDSLYGALGIHPHNAQEAVKNKILEKIRGYLKKEKIVALGEIGLDYHYLNSPKEIQKEIFRKQLNLAKEHTLPVIIHSREATADTLQIIKEEKVNQGVMHCFSGNLNEMRDFFNLGFYISLAGPVTFPKATKAKEVAREVPQERLLIETDCPYLAPQPMRGKRNEPSFLKYILAEIAEIRKMNKEELDEITTKNAKYLFGLMKNNAKK